MLKPAAVMQNSVGKMGREITRGLFCAHRWKNVDVQEQLIELLELQRERQTLERQHQQESNRLNQEIQKARALHNTLQTQYDKVCLQKQGLERDLEDGRGKLKNTESDLKQSQKREMQTEAKLTEVLRESESLTVSLGQMKKQEKALQEEVKRLIEELAEAHKLIKELQAQLAAPPPAVSAPEFSSAGDCFSPSISLHHDRSPPYQHSTQRKRALKTGLTREEERMKYPSGREPGEGIDTELIRNFESEESRNIAHQSGSLRMSETDVDISVTEQDTVIENMDSFLSYSTNATMPKSESDISCNLRTDVRNDMSCYNIKCDSTSLKALKENAELRDELKEVKYELQKRLEDLETQRRAETEARTKLKQLSRKHLIQTEQQCSKSLELKDSIGKLETQLEQEKKETTMLRESLDVFERDAEKRQEEKKKDDEEGTRLKEVLAEMQKKETSMEKEMMGMKKELEDLQLKLAQEQEERESEREKERKKIRREEMEGLKIAQLQEELDNLCKSGSLEEKISKDNVPVTYLQLEHHSSMDKKAALVENDMQESICDSVNFQNTLVCKETRKIEVIMDLGAQSKPTEPPGTTTEGKISTTDITEAADMDSTTILVLEVERLRAARDQEAEKVKLVQGKLEDLQKQVTKETKHLTQAFESQSRHIENLLRELHDKECNLQRQGEELQKCQEIISLLEEETHTREDIILKEASTHPETSTEITRELSSDSVFSNTSFSDHEIFNDDTLHILKEKVLQPRLQLPIEHSVYRTVEETNTSNISHKLQAATDVSELHELCVTSDIHCGSTPTSGTNSEAQALYQILDENGKESEYSTVANSHMQTEQSGVLNLQHDIQEHSTDDVSELEKVTKELQDAQLQLNVIKDQNDELALEGDVSKEELLFVRQENEGLKFRHLDKDTCTDSIAEQNVALPLINTEKNGLSGTNTEQILNSTPSGQEVSVVLDENSKDGEIERMKGTEESTGCEYDHSCKAEVDSLQEQIQALQAQIQHLSEQNRTQAEKLELWKISAMGETAGSNSPTIMLKEFDIFLPCRLTKLDTQTRTIMHQCTVTDMTYRCGLKDVIDQTNSGEHVSTETQMMNDVNESQGSAEDLLTANEMIKENAQHECQSNYVIHSNQSPPVCNAKDKLSILQTEQTDDVKSEVQRIASMTWHQTKAVVTRENGHKDALINVPFQTKVIIAKPTTESNGTEDSQISAPFVSGHNEVETMETAALNQHGHCQGDTTDQQNNYHTAVEVSVPSLNDSNAAQGERAEASKITGDANRMEVREVSTQTEESRDLRFFSGTLEKQPLLHTSTQTDGAELETEEDYNEPAVSPLLPPTPQSVTNQLLFSKAFPVIDPAHLAERIRQNRNRISAAYDDTEYEPYGLPEVVMKGFADIPSGLACPYVLRRGLLGTVAMLLPRRQATPQEENEDIEP
ncbi:trichohyalin-like isoform X3 [Xyrauchen texanus]|uniref:trichohyalin-like isoform X3 n=1 Tax=Xyrauchen texanus TaxID=154827 RepID=UPI002242B409|nr:trichohyalin-like isoform X3 [Xyrauchen texanus]